MKRALILLFPALCLFVVLMSWNGLQGQETLADAVSGSGPVASERTDMSNLALRVSLALAFVVILIFAAIYTLRVLGGNNRGASTGKVKVLDRCYLGPKRALYSVKIGQRVVLLGVTDASIQRVLELSADEGLELYPETDVTSEQVVSFSSVMRGVASKVGRG